VPAFDPVKLGKVLVQHHVAFPHYQDALLYRLEWNQLETLVPRCLCHDVIVPMPPDTVA
jgi:hypothetical protein